MAARDSVLRPKLVSILTSAKPPKSNVSDEQTKALKSLAKDDTIMILPADKGRATVILDKETYKEKVMVMLSDEKTYTRLDKDPTAKYKRKLVDILARLKSENKITDAQKRYLYPTSETIPRLHCTPKIHKKDVPLRPIVDYTGSIMYNLSRSLADILAPLVGKTGHHVENSKDLVKSLQSLTVNGDETLVSFDVVSLFTNTPIDRALEIIKDRLLNDNKLRQRTCSQHWTSWNC